MKILLLIILSIFSCLFHHKQKKSNYTGHMEQMGIAPITKKYLENSCLLEDDMTNTDKALQEEYFHSFYYAHPDRNNPFDIVYTTTSKEFQGVTGENGGFCIFNSKEYGERAGMMLVFGYIKKGFNTPDKFIKRYSATDQMEYIKFISINMGIACSDLIPTDTKSLCLLGHLITVFEGQFGKEGCSVDELQEVVKKFNLGESKKDKKIKNKYKSIGFNEIESNCFNVMDKENFDLQVITQRTEYYADTTGWRDFPDEAMHKAWQYNMKQFDKKKLYDSY